MTRMRFSLTPCQVEKKKIELVCCCLLNGRPDYSAKEGGGGDLIARDNRSISSLN